MVPFYMKRVSLIIIGFLLFLAYSTFQLQNKQKKYLLIGILSSPGNFKQRLSQRQTWLKLSGRNLVKHYFIIGSNLCHIPPKDRLDPYGCEKRPKVVTSENLSTFQFFNKSKDNAKGFGFVAYYKILITHIGVVPCLLKTSIPVRVKLVGMDGKTVAAASFQFNDLIVKAIRPVIFPRNAEGFLVLDLDNTTLHLDCCSKSNKTHGAILINSLITSNNRNIPFNTDTGICTFFRYQVLENDTMAEVALRAALWKRTISDVYSEIENEKKKFNDVVFVNITDVYTNLPKKLLLFLTFIEKSKYDYQYAMKVDDDTFVDLRRVLSELQDSNISDARMWLWTHYREYWSVPRTGKWREERYMSVTYPPFPCGGGYVLSRGIVSFLAAMSENLAIFRGEDVSMGIWLSGFNVETHKNEDSKRVVSYKPLMTNQCEPVCRWTCDTHSSIRPRCNLVQLLVHQMYDTWQLYIKLGFV